MNQNNAIKLLKYQTNSWGKIDELNAQIVNLQKQNERLKTRVDRQEMAIPELREQCKNTRQLARGILIGLLLAGIINTILVFV